MSRAGTFGALAALVALAACATSAETPPEPPPAAAPPTVVEPPKPADTCGADEVRHLVGRPRTEIPVPLKPELQRVACTTCPVTLDFNPNRLNFFFDAQTGIIKEIRCG